ncbi:MAG: zinc ribbon domain-containing protein [Gemmatimonadales bacterium]|nr:zinc ribbon domain-containing protein [Gemmatimonadales bacterium]
MAVFEYHCAACGRNFERFMSLAEHEQAKVKCPDCKSAKVEQVFAPFYAKTIRKS